MKFKCPCCGGNTLEEENFYNICDVCGWEDDPGQREHPDDPIGANEISLNQYKAKWEKTRMVA